MVNKHGKIQPQHFEKKKIQIKTQYYFLPVKLAKLKVVIKLLPAGEGTGCLPAAPGVVMKAPTLKAGERLWPFDRL